MINCGKGLLCDGCLWFITGVYDKSQKPAMLIKKRSEISLLQLEANLIEGEHDNRLVQKNRRRLNVAWQNSNISEMWETGFKNPPTRTPSVLGPVRCHQHTDLFVPAHPLVGQKKRHSLTLNRKLQLQLTIRTSLVSRQRNMSAW